MIIALISGIALGILFFGGLWFTIKKTLGTPYAPLWIFVSSLIRMAIVVTGFYFVAQGSWQRLLLTVAGFIAARFLVIRFTSRFDQKHSMSGETSQL